LAVEEIRGASRLIDAEKNFVRVENSIDALG
jgi:hypothetical protein